MTDGGVKKTRRVRGPSKAQIAQMQESSLTADPAVKESQQLGSNLSEAQIKHHAATNEHNRTEKFRDHFEMVLVLFLYFGALLAAVIVFAIAWHWVMPEKFAWATPQQLDKLQSIVTGGIVSGVLIGHLKKRVGGQ